MLINFISSLIPYFLFSKLNYYFCLDWRHPIFLSPVIIEGAALHRRQFFIGGISENEAILLWFKNIHLEMPYLPL
jgi:hypothetical protein